MKIAIIRGPSLNKFEMQYFEPLAKWHKLTCFTSLRPVYETKSIKLPIVRLACYGQILGWLPGAIKLLSWTVGDPQGLLGLQDKLKGFDLVHTAELFSYYTHQALLAKKKGWVKKVIATVSENIPFNQEETPSQKALKKYALRHLDHIIAISNLSKFILIKEGYSEDKITVIGHGVDLKNFKAQNSNVKTSTQNSKLTILFVGRLVEEKGIWELLEAFKCLKKSYPGIKLVMVGEGPKRVAIEQWVKKDCLTGEVLLKRSVSYDAIPGIYRQADVFVLPSKPCLTGSKTTKDWFCAGRDLKPRLAWTEQFGMVLLEAMASGLAIVSTCCGAIPETVGKTGILVEPGNINQLQKVLEKLILDYDLRRILGKKARLRAEKYFGKEIISRKIEKVWERVSKETQEILSGY